MKLLIVTPDYASHYLPLSAVAGEAQQRGVEVVVATGPSMQSRVSADGFRSSLLRMSRGSNPGVLSARTPLDATADDLQGFFHATRCGMVATLRHQASARATDLLWEPESVAGDVLALIDAERPDVVVVDHLAFSTTLALRSVGQPFTTFVPGHPSQIPVGDEVYGYPVAWPARIRADHDELTELRTTCERVSDAFTGRYNEVLRHLAPGVPPVADAFGAHGGDVLYNSASALQHPDRTALLPARHAFLGSCVRTERATPVAQSWLDRTGDDPFVFVSFGTFLSARTDVLQRVVDALVELDATVALATGTTPPEELGPVPPTWLVASTLPQVALLERAPSVVTHGGNNTVTEALSAGCPMVVVPFSTDQFATAADLERTGLGVALDPNAAGRADIARAVTASLSTDARARANGVAAQLAHPTGPRIAVDRLLA